MGGSAAAQSVDGGRSELPGMKRDIFDQVQGQKGRPPPRGKGPPDCPKSDGWSAFTAIAFTSSSAFVKLSVNEEKCKQLISIGGVNMTQLINASRTCGPAGEFKRRIAENMSSMFFQGGFDWVKSENETLEVVTEDGTFQAHVNEDNYVEMLACWRYGCGCEQANNPIMRGILIAMLVIAAGGLSYDSVKVLWQKIKGKKPAKHVECKNGHRMEKVKYTRIHYCDICGQAGTQYQCGACSSCNYDMCKKCYTETKAKLKTQLKEWYEKHPEDRPKGKKGDENEKDEEEEKEEKEEEENVKSEAEKSDKSGTEADADAKCPTPKTDTEAESEKDKDNEDEPDASNETKEESKEESKEEASEPANT